MSEREEERRKNGEFVVRVCLDDGRVFEVAVDSEDSAREYAGTVSVRGYRHHYGDSLEYFPIHRIKKVAVNGPTTPGFVADNKGTKGWRA